VTVRALHHAAVGTDLFVGSGDDLVQVDRDTLEVVHEYDGIGPDLNGALFAADDEVWIRREGDPFLTAVSGATHEVVASLSAPDYPAGGDVVVSADWIFATANDDGAVLRSGLPD
jgi:hypothetical protein